MKLQVGSGRVRGHYRRRPWINMDVFKFDDVNVRGSGCHLPFTDSSFDEVHCVHVLEHLPRDQYPIMLKEIFRVIEPGGAVFVEVPDLIATAQWLLKAYLDRDYRLVHNWVTSIYGKSDVPGMGHQWGFYELTLIEAIINAGFNKAIRITQLKDMISTHYQQEPILLVKGIK